MEHLTKRELDRWIDFMLESETREDFDRRAIKSRPDMEPLQAIKEVTRWFNRRAVRRTTYEGPASESSREDRSGQPYTWIDLKVIYWAFRRHSRQTAAGCLPTNQTVAMLLGRSVESIVEFRNHQNNIRSIF